LIGGLFFMFGLVLFFGLVNSRAGILGSVPEKVLVFWGFLEVSEGS